MRIKPSHKLITCGLAVLILLPINGFAAGFTLDENGNRTSRISDEAVKKINPNTVAPRPKRLELGPPFLGTGNIPLGKELPGGMIFNPSLLIFGTFRTAIATYKNPLSPFGNTTHSDWSNRLDIFGNLNLSYVNRILIGFQPLHDRNGGVGEGPPQYSGYNFEPDESPTGDKGWANSFNESITTLFFEGDIGEIIPKADLNDFKSLDLGISVGRQPLFYQSGLLINDTIDAVGLIRNNLLPHGGSNLQFTGLYGWNEINRADNRDPENLDMWGLFIQADYPTSIWNLDFVYVTASQGPQIANPALNAMDADPTLPAKIEGDTSDGFHFGLSATQRIGHYNTSFHVLGSYALDEVPDPLPGRPVSAVNDGYLLVSEMSTVLPWTEDNVWLNLFWGIDEFTSAARSPTVGGPLGRVGLQYASVGLGRYLVSLVNQSQNAAGFEVGYQQFFGHGFRRQMVYTLGGRQETESGGSSAAGISARFQQAFGQHTVLQIEGFGIVVDGDEVRPDADDTGYGLRTEVRYTF